jgi:hypothetical protein
MSDGVTDMYRDTDGIYKECIRKDRTQELFRVLNSIKERKEKGKVIAHLDGSGGVTKIEVSQYI